MISFPVILLRLTVALLLGALVGLEREIREHTAGIRTNALVALGSALFTIISAFGFLDLLRLPHIQLDPTRIASYIVAGIGFLGGGAIVFRQDKERVQGLTTAAAVWIVAAIGMACGAGLLWEAIATTLLSLIVLIGLHLVERLFLPHHASRAYHLSLETTAIDGHSIGQVYDILSHNNVTIEKLAVTTEQGVTTVKVACHAQNPATLTSAIGELHTLPGVRAVHADLEGKEDMQSKASS